MTHLSCAACRLRFDLRRTPAPEACPACDGPLVPVDATAALGLSLYRVLPADQAEPPAGAPAWTDALAAALRGTVPSRP
jgi:hypothetical protein